jgi:hypothetical protein
MGNNKVIEWAPFTLKNGIEEAALIEASKALQEEFLQKQDGFIRRELLKKSERAFIDMVWWESKAAAEKAVLNAEKSPVCFMYFQFMEGADHTQPGDNLTYFEVIGEYD